MVNLTDPLVDSRSGCSWEAAPPSTRSKLSDLRKLRIGRPESMRATRPDWERLFHSGLWSMEIHQHHLGMLLRSFEDNFGAVCGNVEVANIKVRREVSQLPLRARPHIH